MGIHRLESPQQIVPKNVLFQPWDADKTQKLPKTPKFA